MAMIDSEVEEKPSSSTATSPAPTMVSTPSATPTADAPLRHWIRRALAGDVVAALTGLLLAGGLRFGVSGPSHATTPYLLLAAGVLVGWPLLGAICGTYELRTSLFGVEELRRVLRAGIYLAALLGMSAFLFDFALSRLFVALMVPLVVGLTALSRLLLRSRTSNWMSAGRHHHRAVAIGSAHEIAELRRQMHRSTKGASPIELVAYVADDLDDDQPAPQDLHDLRRLPNRDAISDFARAETVDLLIRAGRPEAHEMAVITQRAHDLNAWVAIAPHRHDTSANVAVSYVPLGSTPLLMVETPTLRPAAAWSKAILDRVMAAAFLLLGSPLLLAIATTIKLREGGPVLFRQKRVGQHGEHFTCLKFRTMHVGAEDMLTELHDANEHDGPLFKIRDDPRVTKTGRWLRKHSLDELPQLFNVLKGEMSMVGPRPALPSEVETFDVRTRRRLMVKPGLTGLWQVEGRSDLPWDDGVYLDLLYVDHWSPLLDWVIIARTIRVIVRPAGAY
jgi:exopolysaccharide biosynthesis polyprenyl glycosylphosphotransferase